MSPVSGPVRLGHLLSMAYAFCKAHLKTILIAAVVFGTVASLLNATFQMSAVGHVGTMMNDMGMDMQEIEALTERMQAGDETAGDEMEAIMQDRFGSMSDEEAANMGRMIGMNVFKGLLPQIGLVLIVGIILMVAANIYYVVLALGIETEPGALMKRIPRLFFPVLGVWLWAFLRSFVWIPLLGIIPAIILGPRFALASVILLKEKRGVMESVSSSYARTAGYWGKIIGNLIVMGLCLFLASIVVAIVASIVGFVSPWVAMWIKTVMQYAFMAYATAFMVQLALTIMANPIAGVKAPVAAAAPKKVVAAKPVVTKKAAPKKKAK